MFTHTGIARMCFVFLKNAKNRPLPSSKSYEHNYDDQKADFVVLCSYRDCYQRHVQWVTETA